MNWASAKAFYGVAAALALLAGATGPAATTAPAPPPHDEPAASTTPNAAPTPATPIDETIIQATSSGEDLWLLVADASTRSDQPFQLKYMNPLMAPDQATALRRLYVRPDFIVASGDRLFMISRRPTGSGGFDVFSIKVAYNETFDAFYALPRDRTELNDPLPAGRLVALADHFNGPVALMLAADAAADDEPPPKPNGKSDTINDEADATSVAKQSGDTAIAEPPAPSRSSIRVVTRPTLLQLRTSGWMEIPLPEDFDPAQRTLLCSETDEGRQLLVLQASVTDGDGATAARTTVFRSNGDGQWTRRTVQLDLQTVRSVVRAGGRAAAVQTSADGVTVHIGYVRQSKVIALCDFPTPGGSWHVLGADDGLRLITRDKGNLRVATIEPITGAVSEAQELRGHDSRVGRVWFITLMLGLAVGVALMILLVRPAPAQPVAPPKGLSALPLGSRLGALAIDLFAAAVVTMLLTRCSVAQLLQPPLVTPNIIMSPQYMMLVALTIGHTSIAEIIWGTSLGKSMVGGRLISITGDKPTARQVVLRAMGKLLTMLVLPLAVFAMFNRNYQGIDDMLGRTLVVHEGDPPAGAASGH